MEIMLKTKQAGNSQFDFLKFDDILNPYYKHMVKMIKSGKYKPVSLEENVKGKTYFKISYLHQLCVGLVCVTSCKSSLKKHIFI